MYTNTCVCHLKLVDLLFLLPLHAAGYFLGEIVNKIERGISLCGGWRRWGRQQRQERRRTSWCGELYFPFLVAYWHILFLRRDGWENCTALVLEREEVDKGEEVEDVHCEEVEDVNGDEVEDVHGEGGDMQRSVRISRILRKIARQISPTWGSRSGWKRWTMWIQKWPQFCRQNRWNRHGS